jgi:ActR/RegA family two-component response regulator
VKRKFFPAAVVDLDFDSTNGGLDLVRYLHEHSKPTKVVLLAGRRSFEAAVDALRLGVVDIVSKRPDQIGHLKAAVDQAIDRYHASEGSGLVGEMRGAMEDSLKIMFSMARRVYGRGDSSNSGLQMKPLILIIDEDQRFLGELANLVAGKNWEVSVELSGGSGLDKASSFQFQILAVREELSDLPGPMVVKSAQGRGPDLLAIAYSNAGHIDRYERGNPVGRHPFTGAASLVQVIDGLVEELGALRDEKRTLQAFRNEHGAFLRRIAELKARIDAL